MTSNVWGNYFGNEVEVRDVQLLGVMKKYAPDVIGMQEVTLLLTQTSTYFVLFVSLLTLALA